MTLESLTEIVDCRASSAAAGASRGAILSAMLLFYHRLQVFSRRHWLPLVLGLTTSPLHAAETAATPPPPTATRRRQGAGDRPPRGQRGAP